MGFGDRSRDNRGSPRGGYSGGRDSGGGGYSGGRDSGRGGFGGGGRSFGGGRDSGRPQMHDAVCDNCGKDCQVPFKPTSGKPIFCSDCFDQKGGRDNDRSGQRDSGRRNSGDRDRGGSQLAEKIDTLNTKLDTIIDLLSPDKKSKKPKSKREDETAKTTLVEDKDADLKVDTVKEDAKPKPKKKAKVKEDTPVEVEPEAKVEPDTTEEPQEAPPTE